MAFRTKYSKFFCFIVRFIVSDKNVMVEDSQKDQYKCQVYKTMNMKDKNSAQKIPSFFKTEQKNLFARIKRRV